MNILFFNFNKPKTTMPFRRAFGKKEIKAIKDLIKYYNKISEDPPYYGHFQKIYEKEYVKKTSHTEGYARAVSTGTIACYLAVKACQLPTDSEVIMSPVTDSSSLFAIIESDLIPVIADCKPNSYNISLDSIKRLHNKKTSAIYLVHAGGDPADVEEIYNFASENNLVLIEDISQSPFSQILTNNGELKKVGTFGLTSACSTMYRKTLHTGSSGGIVYTKNFESYKRVLEFADRGRPTWKKDYNSRDPGSAVTHSLNYNTDEISCAIGNASLSRIDETINKRRYFKEKIYDLLLGSKYFILPEYKKFSSPFFQSVFVKDEFLEKKEEILDHLVSNNVALARGFQCFVYDWKYTRENVEKVEFANSQINKSKCFNLFFNEKSGDDEFEILKKACNSIIL